MKRLWQALRAAFDERDLVGVVGLIVLAVGLMRVSTTLTLLCVGGILLFVALRR